MAIFPFILLKNVKLKTDWSMINHEKIHLRQQLELLVLPFYILYLINYLINLVRYKNHHAAYLNIIFEKEAYKYDLDRDYLKNGNWYGWLKII
ncbi:hypothetical protein GJU39_09855 [Pedobacter petrophilus]|uniref:DUF4157 domain-containing protein n=2 Tax=Pedobacter petrophilus TaxID=1908241 RepID=A0A7K0FYE1_9SPHI|nr:hypothetical protein [Pedobacter petrophilus]MRX76392.1 hypothetical protein [Pedobacter petrophilus]